MKKEVLDAIIEIVNENYFFLGSERKKWEQLCSTYYKCILDDEEENLLIELFRELGDCHTSYSPRSNLSYVAAPLMWNQNELYWIDQKRDKSDFYKVKTVNDICIHERLGMYREKYAYPSEMIKNLLLEDIIRGRMHKDGSVFLDLDDMGKQFRKTVKAERNLRSPIAFQRTEINSLETKSEVIQGKILYIKINSFYFEQNLDKEISEIDDKVEAIVFDVRNNQGGFISNAKHILGLFLGKDLSLDDYYVIKDKQGTFSQNIDVELNSTPLYGKRVYVLINENTMSSAEYVFTLGLKKAYECILVGQATMGQSGQCKIYEIGGVGILKITTKKYIGTDGNNIGSIVPDWSVHMNIADFCCGRDTQLQYIIDKEVGRIE